jgi:hypothetical protein
MMHATWFRKQFTDLYYIKINFLKVQTSKPACLP